VARPDLSAQLSHLTRGGRDSQRPLRHWPAPLRQAGGLAGAAGVFDRPTPTSPNRSISGPCLTGAQIYRPAAGWEKFPEAAANTLESPLPPGLAFFSSAKRCLIPPRGA